MKKKKKRAKKFVYDEKTHFIYNAEVHEERVRNAGALALNSLKGPARQRVIVAWMNVHWDLVATDELDRIDRKKRARRRR